MPEAYRHSRLWLAWAVLWVIRWAASIGTPLRLASGIDDQGLSESDGVIISFSYFAGEMLGGHVRAVFTLVTVLFIACVSVTITSFPEVPLWLLESTQAHVVPDLAVDGDDSEQKVEEIGDKVTKTTSYGSLSKEDQTMQRNVRIF